MLHLMSSQTKERPNNSPLHLLHSCGCLSLVGTSTAAAAAAATAAASNTFTAIRARRKSVTLIFASHVGQVSSEPDIHIWIHCRSAAGIQVGHMCGELVLLRRDQSLESPSVASPLRPTPLHHNRPDVVCQDLPLSAAASN